MKGIVNFVRPNDYLVPIGDTIGAKTIARWLGDDIQYSKRDVKKWLDVFSSISTGKRDGGYQGTGNTHSVMSINDIVYIECEYDEYQKILITQSQIRNVLDNYMKFLESDYKSTWVEAKPFEVEYEAEGQKALDKYLETGGSLGM